MLILVGLGNPGARYAGNRHNVGFMALDRIAERFGATPWRSRFSGQTAEITAGGEKILLLKPSTYMNESGNAVSQAMNYYRLTPADIVVFYDELDLAPGKIRMKTGGGAAGHNGIRSVAAHIGPDFRRARIGIGHPGHKDRVQPYVLSDFARADRDWLDPLLDAIARHAALLAEGKDASFMNRVHLDTAPPQERDGTDGAAGTESRKDGI